MRRGRGLRWIGVGVLLLVGLYFALDVVTLHYLESRGAAQLARTMAAEDASVHLGSPPFITRFIAGRLSNVQINVRGASAPGGLRVQSISAHMDSVRFSPRAIFSLARSSFGRRTKIEVKDPDATIELGQSDLGDYIRRTIPAVGDVRVKGTGVEVRFLKPGTDLSKATNPTKDDLTDPARYLPYVQDGRIRLINTSLEQIPEEDRADATRIEDLIRLPRIPTGMRSSVRLGNGVISVESTGAKVSLTVGQGGV